MWGIGGVRLRFEFVGIADSLFPDSLTHSAPVPGAAVHILDAPPSDPLLTFST